MNELINIKVIQKDFNGEKKRFVNARELHSWLGVGKRFATWIADRIKKYDFVENLDYFTSIPISGNGKIGLKEGKAKDPKTGRVVTKDYIISVDMAKELAMFENSEVGKKVRKYLMTFLPKETGEYIKKEREISWRHTMKNCAESNTRN